jgi:hypothetical protein
MSIDKSNNRSIDFDDACALTTTGSSETAGCGAR